MGTSAGQFVMTVGAENTWADVVNRYIVGSKLGSQSLGKSHHPGTCHVGKDQAVDGLLDRVRGQVNHSSPAAWHHVGNDFLGHEHGAE